MNLKPLGAKIGKFLHERPIDALFIVFCSLVIIVLSSLYFKVDYDGEHWEQFKAEHHCRLRISETGTQRASWLCDDGKTYFRWRQQR